MGTGMVLAVDETDADEVVKFFNENGEKAYLLELSQINQVQ